MRVFAIFMAGLIAIARGFAERYGSAKEPDLLIVDDPDAPSGVFVHWLVYGIPPGTTQFDEGSIPKSVHQGRNGFGDIGYGGPQPPSGTHRYFFHLYALDREIDLPPGASHQELDAAMRGHVLEEAQLMGQYAQLTQSAR